MSKNAVCIFVIFLLFGIHKVSSQNQEIFITRVQNWDNSVEFNYVKEGVGTYFLELELENVENVENSATLKTLYNFNLTASSGTLFKLYPSDKQSRILCSYSFSYKRGAIEPRVDTSVTYELPFKENKKITIYETTRFNVNADVWKNYLVYSKTKDTIYGMRKGIVVDIRKFSITSDEKANGQAVTLYKTEVIVEHADGTNASYTGLDPNLLLVKVNDIIYPQSPLGVMDDIIIDGNRTFKFNVYYFSKEEMANLNGKKSKIIEKSVMPYFLTDNGIKKLASDYKYIVTCNDAISSQEMTSEEKEKFSKATSIN